MTTRLPSCTPTPHARSRAGVHRQVYAMGEDLGQAEGADTAGLSQGARPWLWGNRGRSGCARCRQMSAFLPHPSRAWPGAGGGAAPAPAAPPPSPVKGGCSLQLRPEPQVPSTCSETRSFASLSPQTYPRTASLTQGSPRGGTGRGPREGAATGRGAPQGWEGEGEHPGAATGRGAPWGREGRGRTPGS